MTPGWNTTYLSIALVGSVEEAIWQYPTWMKAVDILAPITKRMAEPIAVRAVQDDGQDGPKLGRLTWNAKGHQKWAHGSPANSRESKNWRFHFGEIWSPSWSKCGSSDRAPDFFMGLWNHLDTKETRKGAFNQFVSLALALENAQEMRRELIQVVSGLGGLLKADPILGRITPWYQGGKTLQDEINNHVRYGNIHLAKTYDVTQTRVSWEPFDHLSW
jgi:hypothetical protein